MIIQNIKYASVNDFMLACGKYDVQPTIHWREDEKCKSGYIYFRVLKRYEDHIFYSNDKSLLNAVWNSVGLIRRALRLVEDKAG